MEKNTKEEKQITLQQRLDKQIRDTQQFYNLWQQSQGAVTMLQELLKEAEGEYE